VASDQPSPLHVLIVGAGFGGIGAAIGLRRRGIADFRIVERGAGIGGTWWHNTYPGAACDIESHLYCFSFAPNPRWSRKYSPQAEIQAYIEHCADAWDLRRHIALGTGVSALRFCDASGLWRAALDGGGELRARHVILATGGLHLPAWPDIPGRGHFAGPAMHSAQWDHGVDFAGRRVAVIGSAASAIQLVPELAKTAARVDVYQRTPNYIAPRHDRAFSEREKSRFARHPLWQRLYREWLFLQGEWFLFPLVRHRRFSPWRSLLEARIKQHIRRSVRDPVLRGKLLPDYPLGCKRILISDDFYQTLARDNVELVTAGIERIEPRGVVTRDGRLHPADILVCATGFDVQNYPLATPITGPGGRELAAQWAERPNAYKGGFIPGFPNLYLLTGPNTGVGTTSVVYMIEAQLELVLQVLDAAGEDRLIEVTDEANLRYNGTIRAALADTVWAGDCKSWYKRADGEITTLYPFDARSFRRDHRRLVRGDFLVTARAAQL